MIYTDLAFPEPPPNRPLVYANMVATIDGRTVAGTRDDDVVGLGSKFDQSVMDMIERSADAILLGAGSVRANPPNWNPHCGIRIAVSRSGELPWDVRYFTGGHAYVAVPVGVQVSVPEWITVLRFGDEAVDLKGLLQHLRSELGVRRLHGLGGASLNGELIRDDLLDELFLTIAPKIKLGYDVPTYAIGDPLPREALKKFTLIEHHVESDEVYLRYRRLGL